MKNSDIEVEDNRYDKFLFGVRRRDKSNNLCSICGQTVEECTRGFEGGMRSDELRSDAKAE